MLLIHHFLIGLSSLNCCFARMGDERASKTGNDMNEFSELP